MQAWKPSVSPFRVDAPNRDAKGMSMGRLIGKDGLLAFEMRRNSVVESRQPQDKFMSVEIDADKMKLARTYRPVHIHVLVSALQRKLVGISFSNAVDL